MTKMQLQRLYWIKKNIKKLEDRLAELEAEATRVTTQISPGRRGTRKDDKISDVVSKIVELQDEINYQLKRAYAIEKEIETAIRSLPEREAYLIRLRYIDLMSWEQICVEMNYQWAQVHRIHASALKLLTNPEIREISKCEI